MSRQVNYSRIRPISEFCILNSEFRRRLRRGYSMAELMIVLVIMVMLVAAALPVAKKVMDDSHVREASRQLNAYFAMAKARAIHTGRPCGIHLEAPEILGISRVNGLTWPVRHVTQMHLAEVPAPYSGSYLDSRAGVTGGGGAFYFTPTDTNEYAVLQSL